MNACYASAWEVAQLAAEPFTDQRKQKKRLALPFGLMYVYHASVRDVAQLVERLVWDQEAASSSPAVPTILFSIATNAVWDHAAREAEPCHSVHFFYAPS